MARTYTHTPYIIPYIFADIVSKVSNNLSTDDDLPSIPRVSYKYGSWLEILGQLVKDGNSPNFKSIKYPLVCLIYDIQENYLDETNDSIRVDILICTDSTPTMKLADRYSTKFEPILNPIYAELKSQIARSKYFTGYNQKFRHTKIDKPHLGQQSAEGPVAYKLPDFIDGILLQGIELKVNQSQCNKCVPLYQFESLDAIVYGTLDKFADKVLQITYNDDLVDSTYSLYLDGELAPIIGPIAPDDIPLNTPINILYAELSNGVHKLECISSTGSQADLLFSIENTVLTTIINSLDIDVSYDLPCGVNKTNTFTYNGELVTSGYIINSQQFQLEGTSVDVNEQNAVIEVDGVLTELVSVFEWFIRVDEKNTIKQKTILTIKNNL